MIVIFELCVVCFNMLRLHVQKLMLLRETLIVIRQALVHHLDF